MASTLCLFARIARYAALTVVAVLLAGGAWFGYRYAIGNIHTVEAGQLYRSGTLFGHQLKTLIEDKGIKTIINLRGNQSGRVWYDTHVEIARALGVMRIDIPLSALRDPKPEIVERLLVALRTSERPILVHCEAGADRSSFASAVFAHLHLGRSIDVAERQLTLFYGHETWTNPRKAAMRRAFRAVAEGQSVSRLQVASTSGDLAGR